MLVDVLAASPFHIEAPLHVYVEAFFCIHD
jgi:SAM-dependent methyltransferase